MNESTGSELEVLTVVDQVTPVNDYMEVNTTERRIQRIPGI
jgi:hypothetical protein